jgi:hypothetical protein
VVVVIILNHSLGILKKGLKGKLNLIMNLDSAIQSHMCLFHVLWFFEGSILVVYVDPTD